MPRRGGVMEGSRTRLGNVFLIIDGIVRRYGVSCRLDADDCWALYTFVDTSEWVDGDKTSFNVKVSDKVDQQSMGLSSSLHREILRYGCVQKAQESDKSEFWFLEGHWLSWNEARPLFGPDLRLEILRLLFAINRFLPMERLDEDDLSLMINGSGKDIKDMTEALSQEGLLISERRRQKARFENTVRIGSAFRLSPDRAKDIEREINSWRSDKRNGDGIDVFLSYSSKDKSMAGKLKRELSEHGLNVFLAHEDIDPSDEWVEVIQGNLESCDVFLPLLTDNFKASDWTDQETGHAFAKNKLIIPLKTSRHNPHGFIWKLQAAIVEPDDIKESCKKLVEIIQSKLQVSVPSPN